MLAYLFSTTFNPENVQAFVTMILLLITGVVLSIAMVGVQFIGFSFKSLAQDLTATMVSFISIYYVNRLVPAEIGVSPMNETSFGVLAGVSEEWFFRLWLCAWIFKVTHSMVLAIFVSSFAWAIFHIARYGASLNALWLVFLAGIPLGYFTLAYRSADGPSFGHMLVNAFARK